MMTTRLQNGDCFPGSPNLNRWRRPAGTATFQAPGFYERLGYERKYVIEGRPKGYADIIYVTAVQRTAPQAEPTV